MPGIGEHPFFQGLSEENQALLARVLQPRHVPAGEMLFGQGDPADTALFIQRGQVELSVRLPGGGLLALAPSGAGDLLGELALIERHRRAATARVVADLEALEMHRDDLRALCAVRHPASLSMLRRLGRLVAERIIRVNAERVPQPTAECLTVNRAAWRAGAGFAVERFLPVLPLFENFSATELEDVVERARTWTMTPGEPLALYGDAPASCFIVVRGAVKATLPTAGGARRLGVYGPGAPAGVLSAMLDRPRSATWATCEPSTLLELPAGALADLRHPGLRASFRFQEGLLRALMHRLEQTTRALTGERRLNPKGATG